MYRELVRNLVRGGSLTVLEGDEIIISHEEVAGKNVSKEIVARYKIPKGTPLRTFSHAIIFEVEGEHGMRDAIGGMLANPEEA